MLIMIRVNNYIKYCPKEYRRARLGEFFISNNTIYMAKSLILSYHEKGGNLFNLLAWSQFQGGQVRINKHHHNEYIVLVPR